VNLESRFLRRLTNLAILKKTKEVEDVVKKDAYANDCRSVVVSNGRRSQLGGGQARAERVSNDSGRD
jgi:hypothetical protein